VLEDDQRARRAILYRAKNASELQEETPGVPRNNTLTRPVGWKGERRRSARATARPFGSIQSDKNNHYNLEGKKKETRRGVSLLYWTEISSVKGPLGCR